MSRQPVCVVGDGDQAGASAKHGNATAGMVHRDTQKAIRCPLGGEGVLQNPLELLAGWSVAGVKTKVTRVL